MKEVEEDDEELRPALLSAPAHAVGDHAAGELLALRVAGGSDLPPRPPRRELEELGLMSCSASCDNSFVQIKRIWGLSWLESPVW